MDRPEAVPRLKRPLGSVLTVDVLQGLKLPETIRSKPRDQPILVAVIDAKAGQLLSGDRRRSLFRCHFVIDKYSYPSQKDQLL